MIKKKRKQVEILGVRVDSTTTASVLSQVEEYVKKGEKFFIVTPNPEIVLEAQSDPKLKRILNSASISLPDGVGILAANKFLSLPNLPNSPKHPNFPNLPRILNLLAQGLGVGFSIIFDREWITRDLYLIRGRDMFNELVGFADRNRYRIFLLGGEYGEAVKAKKGLEKSYSLVKIKAAGGPIVDKEGLPVNAKQASIEKETVQEINEFKPHILFIGMGAPKQEKWVYRWLPKLSVRGVMVVGGTFNYVSGQRKSPPDWLADRGLEWLWRLLSGSQRSERINSAIFEFPIRIFWSKLILTR